MTRRMRPLAERFWEKVDKSGGPDACWPWTGARDPHGYGRFRVGSKTDDTGRTVLAHRQAYELENGPLPDDVRVLHRCDNPPCCNPKDLRPGTDADNIADCISKGRDGHTRGTILTRQGIDHHKAVLTDDDVINARRRYRSGQMDVSARSAFAAEKGITRAHLWAVLTQRSWKHLP